ncbi:MAG TPA: serine hydrolase domain-containing protein [Vicinamibacterales bacterium]|nr:serine hydrolase domain-containing protein [Vicinamibacterales bacterium]
MTIANRTASLIERAVASRAFPAATIETGRRDRVLWRQAFGHLTYEEDAPAARDDTIFDLASLTKVIATTTMAMHAVDEGALALDDRIADRLSAWRGADRQNVTIADLLEHASGLTAYLPFFRDHHGRVEFERAICTMPLEYAPRTRSIYSDLGFMLLGFILEDIYGKPFPGIFDAVSGDRTFRDRTFRLQAEDPIFNPPRELRDRCAPTELDLWRGRLLQGEVHDENAWALGGAAGHAGLFGTAAAVGAFARTVLAHPETLARVARKSTVPGSSRALGWDTMLPTSSCGTRLSPRAIGHTGFTGTSLWIDPERDLYVVFLTNRVHPTRENNGIQDVRRAVHDQIVDDL